MKREHRYMVAKYKDVLAYLAEAEQQQLLSLFRTIHIGREEDGKRNLECVCVEDDWPEYEIVWSMIATRVDGGTPSVIQTLSERREVGMNGTVVDCLKSEVAELRAALAAEPTMPLLPLPPAQSSEQSLEAAIMALMPKCDDSTQFVCGYLQARNDAAALVASARPSVAQGMPAQEQAQSADYEEVLAGHRRLVRELDVLLNGDGAAKQASLCDIVAQVAREKAQEQAASVVPNVYAECRKCDECHHTGINDASDVLAACNACSWGGDSPAEDKCPGCGATGTMIAACPKCGGEYSLLADASLSVSPVAPQPSARELTDAECRRIKNQAAVDVDEWADSLTCNPTQDDIDGFFVRAILESVRHFTGNAGAAGEKA